MESQFKALDAAWLFVQKVRLPTTLDNVLRVAKTLPGGETCSLETFRQLYFIAPEIISVRRIPAMDDSPERQMWNVGLTNAATSSNSSRDLLAQVQLQLLPHGKTKKKQQQRFTLVQQKLQEFMVNKEGELARGWEVAFSNFDTPTTGPFISLAAKLLPFFPTDSLIPSAQFPWELSGPAVVNLPQGRRLEDTSEPNLPLAPTQYSSPEPSDDALQPFDGAMETCDIEFSQLEEHLKRLPHYVDQLSFVHEFPASSGSPPVPLNASQLRCLGIAPSIAALVKCRGITSLYSHQAQAIAAVKKGCHVAITTATSSGKSLAFNIPVMSALVESPAAVAFYLFPTKVKHCPPSPLQQPPHAALRMVAGLVTRPTTSAPSSAGCFARLAAANTSRDN